MKTSLPEKSMVVSDYLAGFKEVARKHFGKRLKYLVLYGSYARGDFNENSDIDILVVLDHVYSEIQEIDALATLKTDLQLDYDKYISTNPVSIEKFENAEFSFYRNVKQEGVLL
jgi:predicted nucleotidyltransferase